MSLSCLDSGRVSESWGCLEVSRSVWHHHHHGAHGGAQESLQWTGGRSPEADELRVCPNWSLWLHEAILHSRHWEWASLCLTSKVMRVPPHLFVATNIHMSHRCWHCHSALGRLHYRGHGCGFCTTDRCGEGAFPSPGTTGWWWEKIQRHPRCLQDDCSRWGHTGSLERCQFYFNFFFLISFYLWVNIILKTTVSFLLGCVPNITRNAIVNCAELVTYDMIKELILKYDLMTGAVSKLAHLKTNKQQCRRMWLIFYSTTDNLPCHFTAAFGAGFCTTVVASPVDVVKTRFMNSGSGQYSSAINCALTMLRHEGPTAFYKG